MSKEELKDIGANLWKSTTERDIREAVGIIEEILDSLSKAEFFRST